MLIKYNFKDDDAIITQYSTVAQYNSLAGKSAYDRSAVTERGRKLTHSFSYK